jgi:hypothetical protein
VDEIDLRHVTGCLEATDAAEAEAEGFARYLSRVTGAGWAAGERAMLVGLHACGDLTPSLLRAFVAR